MPGSLRGLASGVALSLAALALSSCGATTDAPRAVPVTSPVAPSSSAAMPGVVTTKCRGSQLRTKLPGYGVAAGVDFYNIAIENEGAACILDMRVKDLRGISAEEERFEIPFSLDAAAPDATLHSGDSTFISVRTGTACVPHARWERQPYAALSLAMTDGLRLRVEITPSSSEPTFDAVRLPCDVTIASGPGTGA